ncbi:MAG: PD-(D/E)XK nuclease family protein [Patescibacteria group bacterium]
MSSYYYGKRTKNLFDPKSKHPYPLSRSKLENFLKCQKCFYVDRRLGVDQPPGFPFSLNSAVDTLLKKEFDIHRMKQSPHPLMEQYGVDAIPFEHPKIDEWRDPFVGIQYYHEPSGFMVSGGVDDIWRSSNGELLVVDYKATSKNGEVRIDAPWQEGYKRQVEIYQWLLRNNGFSVSPMGYFVYVNGRTDAAAFDAKLEFDAKIIPYEGDDSWIQDALLKARSCLVSDMLPQANPDCDFCVYRKAVQGALVPFEDKMGLNELF